MEKTKSQKIDFSKYGKVVSFFALEVLAFISFSLGNSFILYSCLALALFVALAFVTFKQIKKEGIPTFAFFLFPIFIFGLLSALSNFVRDPGFHISGFGLAFIPLGFVFFACCGYLLAHEKHFDISKALLVIYIALGIYVFINFIATMVEFAPFHTLTYKGHYLFYNGALVDVPVSQMAYGLIGFRFYEININYYLLYPMILLSCSLFLFFIKYKENRKLFVTYACLTGLALITIIFSISLFSLFMLLGVLFLYLLVLLYGKKRIDTKFTKVFSIVITSAIGLFFLVVILNAQYVLGGRITGLQNLISDNTFLNRVFNGNYIVRNWNIAADGLFSQFKLFGIFTGSVKDFTDLYDFKTHYGVSEVYPTSSWFFDLILTSGTFGLLFFIIFIVFVVYIVIKYYKNSLDSVQNKVVLIAFMLGLFAYSLFAYDMSVTILNKTLIPFTMNNLFCIFLILIGYCAYAAYIKPKPAENNEVVIGVETINLDKKEGGKNDEISC